MRTWYFYAYMMQWYMTHWCSFRNPDNVAMPTCNRFQQSYQFSEPANHGTCELDRQIGLNERKIFIYSIVTAGNICHLVQFGLHATLKSSIHLS